VFAKADPAAYTEESIAASKSLQDGPASSGHAENGHATNGHADNGHADNSDASNGHNHNGHATNGQKGPSGNDQPDDHHDSSNGTVKEVAKASKSNGGKVGNQRTSRPHSVLQALPHTIPHMWPKEVGLPC